MSNWNAFKDWQPDPATVIADTSKPGTRQRPAKARNASDDKRYSGTEIAPHSERQAPPRGDEAPARVQRIEVPAVAPSINELYTMHQMARSSRAKRFKALVQICAREQGLRPVERYPVTVHVVCHFGPGKRQYDWENLALSAKFAGDGLRAAGILQNDSPPYVRLGTLEPRRTKRESYMEYFIHEANE